METRPNLVNYWKENLKYLVILLCVWFAVSYLAGILAVDALDSIRIGGFKFGYWMANNGSEIIFCLLIVTYVKLMRNLDRKYGVEED